MHSVKVNRFKLLEKVGLNRKNHRELFEKAQVGFRQAVVEELDKMLASAKDGKKLRLHVGLEAPEDHTEDYDRVIAMLGMSVDTDVTIDATSFQQFVMDKWAWSHHALTKNTAYASGGVFRTDID